MPQRPMPQQPMPQQPMPQQPMPQQPMRAESFGGGEVGSIREGPHDDFFPAKVTEFTESSAAGSPSSCLEHMLEAICARQGDHVAEGRLGHRDDLTLEGQLKDGNARSDRLVAEERLDFQDDLTRGGLVTDSYLDAVTAQSAHP